MHKKGASYHDPTEISSWIRERVLGSGGFGTVTLWRNKNGGRLIAIKKCRFGTDNLLTPKQKERWKKEVEIMMKLNHPNVIKVFPLPDDLKSLHTDLPVLCMEYCNKGDLRQVLNRSENSCGLIEPDVREVTEDLVSALKYLHAQRITHRDLKPENIVLSSSDSRKTLYKLIDLGYAKELEKSSICTSFVGTLQYLAPEIFATDNLTASGNPAVEVERRYTCSVDYWSLGLVVHESITGVRPFLPNMAPATWMKQVAKKGSEHICAYQTVKGIVEFSSHLFMQNHISSCLKKDIEVWLRSALQWDPKKRGRDHTNTITIFSMMENILARKIIRIFSMPNYRWLSYEYEDSTPVHKLQTWIEHDTSVLVRDQELLLSSRKAVDYSGLVRNCVTNPNEEPVYLLYRHKLDLPTVIPNLPPMVVSILQSPRDPLEYNYLKRTYANAIFFLQQENSLYREFLTGLRLKTLSVSQQCQTLLRVNQQLTETTTATTSLKEFSIKAHKLDVLHVKEATRVANLASDLAAAWKKQIEATERKWQMLHLSVNSAATQTRTFSKRLHDIQSSVLSSHKEDSQLVKLENEGVHLLDALRRRSTLEKNKPRDPLEMVKVIYGCLKHRDVILRDQAMTAHCREIFESEADIQKAVPMVESTLEKMEAMKMEIQENLHARQKVVWQLVNIPDRLSPSRFPPLDPLSLTNCTSPTGPTIQLPESSQTLSQPRPAATSQSPEQPSSPLLLPHHQHQPLQIQHTPSHQSERRLSTASQHSGRGAPSFNLSVSQEPCTSRHDSGIAGYNSFMKRSSNGCRDDDEAVSMIDENKSLRLTTQELMMQSYSQCLKLINENRSMDWSFLNS